jgi:hypothetical protein
MAFFWIKNVSKVDLQRFLQQTWISSELENRKIPLFNNYKK